LNWICKGNFRVVTDLLFLDRNHGRGQKKEKAIAVAIAISAEDRGHGRDLFCDRH
jgi:hypothetical protein